MVIVENRKTGVMHKFDNGIAAAHWVAAHTLTKPILEWNIFVPATSDLYDIAQKIREEGWANPVVPKSA